MKKKRLQTSQKKAINILIKDYNKSKLSFEKQMSEDGWAGNLADGISALWGSENRANKVEKNLKSYKQNLIKLKKAVNKDPNIFNAEFKKIFGVAYNQKAIEEYSKNPTPENYKKAFGTKNNIQDRVSKYNESQQTGASVVKTTTKIGAGVAIGIATGGAGFAAVGISAAATAASSVAINTSDRLSSDVGLKDGEMKEIIKEGAWDGASVIAGGAVGKLATTAVKGASTSAKIARETIKTAGDVTVGAAQEYAETGQISASGTITNATLGAIGITAEAGGFKKAKNAITKKISKTNNTSTTKNINKLPTDKKIQTKTAIKSNNTISDSSEPIAGGFFNKKSDSPSFINRLFGTSNKQEPITPTTINKKIQNNTVRAQQMKEGNVSVSKRMEQALDSNTQTVKDLGNNIDLNNISRHIKNGEVCTVGTGSNQKLYVNQNGKAVELKLSKEKFEELFPKTGFALIEQKGHNNCWLVSRLNSMINSSYGRAELYSMLEETPNGDIIVHLKQSSKPIKFPGGKPVNAENTLLGEGASPGIEMIHQAVLIKNLKNAEERVSDVTQLNINSLMDEANRLNHFDSNASKYLLNSNTNSTISGANIVPALENFKTGQDMGVITWSAHARSLTDFNPQTRMVTYHDPMIAGVDITCPVENLINNGAILSIKKAPTSTVLQNQSPTIKPIVSNSTNAQTMNTSRQKATSLDPENPTQTSTNSDINTKTTTSDLDIPNGYRKTKLGKMDAIIGPNKELFVKTEYGWEAANRAAKNVDIESLFAQNSSAKVKETSISQPKTTQLEIPDGFREYNTKIMGKRAIIGPDNVVMYETKNGWKRIN